MFFLSLLLLVHSYILYPFILKLLFLINGTKKISNNNKEINVSILIAAYNEEAVLKKKIESIISSDYDFNKIEVLVGSDGSKDKTNEIVIELNKLYPQVKLFEFSGRNGKPAIIDKLKEQALYDILIVTDANVIFNRYTIPKLVRHFNDNSIGLVDTRMVNTGLKKEGISIQEKSYISMEVQLKYHEGQLFGSLIGPFGGCYAIRKSLMSKVPKGFLVDDFFICMKVLESGFKAINDKDSIVYEDVSNLLSEEFRRKTRIATGNIQNLFYFKHLFLHLHKAYSYCFFSHKFLRWIGPILLIIIYISNLLLVQEHFLYFYIFIGQNIFYVSGFIDVILKKFGIHNVFLRYITHFIAMNIALMVGMFQYTKGIKSNVWEPTQRFQ